jgi:hypothetical protein
VLTTSAAFSGTLINSATVSAAGGITDTDPGNNTVVAVPVSVLGWSYRVLVPYVLSPPPTQ